MPEPRNPEPIEQTLLPGSLPVPPSAAPADTPAHPGARDVTVKPHPPVAPNPRPVSSPSVTEADMTRAPVSGTGTSAASSPVDATQVPPSSRTSLPDKTIGNSQPTAPLSSPTATGTQVGRFALKGLHARGGLGEVFTARDTELNREVAIKRIQSRYADDPASRRRFLTEAEITARLDHPGVVPVFGLVADGFGRPCYAMRFIRGETLKDEIERYHGTERAAATPDSHAHEVKHSEAKGEVRGQPRSVAFRHLLQRFIAVCQAIAYAHTRKVIHRDIKPANVMVGAFGETLVVDWGLAKALDDGPAPEQLLKAVAAAGFRHDPEATELPDHLTMAGTAVGTPAYMAPEQASGRLELVGPAADVYSLGATLFAILTGRAPFSGNTTETLEKVRRGDFPAPIVQNPEVPAPLDAVCRKAMSLRIEDRYTTPLDLATDVERWLSDEPVSCHRDPFVARLARWARRHPARVATGVSLLLAGVFAAAGIALAVYAGEQETNRAMLQVKDQEQKTADEMKKVKQEKEKNETILIQLRGQKKQTDDQRQAAEDARGVAENRSESSVQAYKTLVFGIQRRLADRSGTQDLRKDVLMQAQEGLKSLLKSGGAEKIGADRTLVAAHQQMGDVYQLLGNTRDARLEYKQAVRMAVEVLGKAQERQSVEDEWKARQDYGLSNIRLADIQLQAGDTTAAKQACEIALEQFQKTYDQRPTDRGARENLAAAHDQFGDILIERGETVAADEQCRQARDIRRKLVADAKADLKQQPQANNLDQYLNAQRQLADSLDQYAEILLRAGLGSEARHAAEECLDIRVEVSQKLPRQPDVTRELAAARSRLGEILLDREELVPCRKEFEAARDILKKLYDEDHRSAGAKAALAVSYGQLAVVALRCGNLRTALADATESNKLCKEVDTDDPDSTRTTRELATSCERLGDVWLACGESYFALTWYQKSEKLLGPIAIKDQDSALAKQALAHALERVGAGLLAIDNPTGAIKALTDSLDLRKEVLAVGSSSARFKLTDQVFVVLKSQNVPESVLMKLNSLKNKEFSRDDFEKELNKILDADETKQFHRLILNQAPNSGSVRAKRELALGLMWLSDAYRAAGQLIPAREKVTQAVTLLRQVVEADKENRPARRELALAIAKWGEVLAEDGKRTVALITLLQSLDQFRMLANADKENPHAQADLADGYERLADLYAHLGQTTPAMAAAHAALAFRTALAKAAGNTKAANRELAISMIRVADTHAATCQFDVARKWYKSASELVTLDSIDAMTSATARSADEKVALLDAVKALERNPTQGLVDVPQALHIPALRLATKWFLMGNKTVLAASTAWQFATAATAPEDRYKSALALARCAQGTKITQSARDGYKDDAVKALELAVAVGFRDAELLNGPEWDVCRDQPGFPKVLELIAAAKPLAPNPRPVLRTK